MEVGAAALGIPHRKKKKDLAQNIVNSGAERCLFSRRGSSAYKTNTINIVHWLIYYVRTIFLDYVC